MFLREIRMISVIEGVIEGLIHPIAEKIASSFCLFCSYLLVMLRAVGRQVDFIY